MDMTGERRIPASRQLVWSALNDPDVLRATIPGCESLEKQSDTAMKAVASVKIGPISARFTGNVQLSDMDPPNGYTISGEGQGGVAGFAKGGAKVKLDDDSGATLLRYEVHAQVGGKIAQLGARLVDATAKQLADQFFDRFSARVVAAPAEVAAAPAAVLPAATPSSATSTSAAPVFPLAPAHGQGHGSPVTTQVYPAAPSSEVAEPVLPPAYPQSSISILALIPREPFGLPLVAWIGGVIYLFIVLLFIGSIF
ncbi:MAG TPA: carbon monoxide dehydrogenase subunit G [Acetobacteraceae bacterium]|nr:carbon monoxide dehydrogenase subunit G [Acetobacteraceae bacterium]